MFIASGSALAMYAFFNDRKAKEQLVLEEATTKTETQDSNIELDWEDIEHVDQIGLEIGYGLVPLVSEQDGGLLLSRVRGIRKKLSAELGFLIQPIRIRDNLQLEPTSYNIVLKGAVRGSGMLQLGQDLAINPGDITVELEGIATKEPAFGLDAYWIDHSNSDYAKTLGYTIVDSATVIATHLNALLRNNASDLLGHDETREMLDKVAQRSPKLIEDLVPDKLSVTTVMQVLKNILFESISIRDINTILGTLLVESTRTQNPDELTELVRPKLGYLMLQEVVDHGELLNVITLDPNLEQMLISSVNQSAKMGQVVIEPTLIEGLMESVKKQKFEAEEKGYPAVIVVAPTIRAWLARMIKIRFNDATVLSYTEIPEDQKIKVFGRIGLASEEPEVAES